MKPILIGQAQQLPDLNLVQGAIETHLGKIQRIFGPDYKLTLVANHTGYDDTSADVVLTQGVRHRIIQAVDRFVPLHAGAPRPAREYLVVYGPPCSGKTLNAEMIIEVLGYDYAFDAAAASPAVLQSITGRVVLFSHTDQVRDPDDRKRFILWRKSIEQVKRELGHGWIEPDPQYAKAVDAGS